MSLESPADLAEGNSDQKSHTHTEHPTKTTHIDPKPISELENVVSRKRGRSNERS